MRRAKYPSKEWLQSRFSYLDGHLYDLNGNIIKEYGPSKTNKYISVYINRKMLCLHRLIYIFHNGEPPEGYDIDHINRNPIDNRIENLRACTRSLNTCNSKPRIGCKSGVRGISIRNTGKFAVMVCGKYLGQFDTIDEASKYRDNYIAMNVK